jgi:hypothetical protein
MTMPTMTRMTTWTMTVTMTWMMTAATAQTMERMKLSWVGMTTMRTTTPWTTTQ